MLVPGILLYFPSYLPVFLLFLLIWPEEKKVMFFPYSVVLEQDLNTVPKHTSHQMTKFSAHKLNAVSSS